MGHEMMSRTLLGEVRQYWGIWHKTALFSDLKSCTSWARRSDRGFRGSRHQEGLRQTLGEVERV